MHSLLFPGQFVKNWKMDLKVEVFSFNISCVLFLSFYFPRLYFDFLRHIFRICLLCVKSLIVLINPSCFFQLYLSLSFLRFSSTKAASNFARARRMLNFFCSRRRFFLYLWLSCNLELFKRGIAAETK